MQVELRDSLANLFPDSVPGKRPAMVRRVAVGRGGIAAVHVLATELTPGAAIRLELRGQGLPLRTAQWFRLVDVPVEENTGMEGFTENTRWDDGTSGGANPYVIRKAPFRVYDAMAPVSSRLKAKAATMAFRLHLPIPRGARPGLYALRVVVSASVETIERAWKVEVFKAIIPP